MAPSSNGDPQHWVGLGEIDPDDDALLPPGFDATPEDEVEGEGGYPDHRNLVRLWLDDEDVICKVRLSAKWFDRLGGWRGLEQAFGEAFAAVALDQLPTIEVSDEDASAPVSVPRGTAPLSEERLAEHTRRANDLLTQLAALPAEANGTWHQAPATGHSRDRSVSITLRPDGSLATITFDDELLAGSLMRDLEANIIAAHRDARTRFQPPTREPGERDRLLDQFGAHADELVAMIMAP